MGFRWLHKKYILFGLPLLLLLGGGGAYAAIHLNASPVTQTTPQTAVQIGSLEKGLVGEWKLNGNTKDSTPYGNDGTLVGSPASTDGPDGQADGAYQLNGTSQYIHTGNFSAIDYTKSYTIAAWVNPSTFTNAASSCGDQRRYIVSSVKDANDYVEVSVDNQSGGGFRFLQMAAPGQSYVAVRASGSYAPNEWYEVAAEYDQAANQWRLYVDGTLAGSASAAGLTLGNPAGAPLTFGYGAINCNFPYLQGSIADVRAYNRALSAAEVQQLYDSYNSQINLGATTAPSGQSVSLTKGMVGYWPFNGSAKDATPYSDNGTVNGASLTTDRFGNPNSAYSFSGSGQYIQIPTAAALDLADNFSVAAWVYMRNTATGQGLVHKGTSTLHGAALAYGWDGGGFEFINWNQSNTPVAAPSVSDLNQWHYLVGVVSSGVRSLYVDGNFVSSSSAGTSSWNNDNDLYIGSSGNPSNFANAVIDAVRIYSRALSADEVAALYNLDD